MNLREFSRRFEDSRPFHELLNIACFIDSETFLTKDGSVGLVLKDVGIDEECLEPARLDLLVSKRVAALRAFDDRFDISQYTLKRSSPPADAPVFKNPALNQAAENRTTFFKQKGVDLYSFENYLVVICKPAWASPRLLERLSHLAKNPRKAFRTSFTRKGKVTALDEPLEKAVRTLRQAVNSFIEQLGDDVPIRVLKAAEAFRFFRRLVNPSPAKAEAVPLTHDQHVDFFAVDSELEAHRDHLRLDNYFLKLLTLKAPPSRTFANMLRELRRIKSDLVIVSNWNLKDTSKAVAAIRSQRRHHHNLKVSILSHMTSEQPSERAILYDGSKEALVENLGDLLTEIDLKGSLVQEYSLAIKVIADSLEAAERASAEAMKVLGKYEGALNDERYNLLNAFLAALPGGYPFNLRKLLLTNRNVADMALWFLPSEGERRNSFLDAPALATFETLDNTLYSFNLHVGDVGHTIALGSTGSGKSFLMNFLLVHALQYDPYAFIFDVGDSYQWLTELVGGSYISVRPGAIPFKINPFSLKPTRENLQFLFLFFKLLIALGEHRLSDDEERDLYECISAVYVLDPPQRRLLTLSTTVRRSIGKCLKRWTEGEQYGEWFDHAEDTVSFSRFQCVNFESFERLGTALEPVLFYLLHRASDIIRDAALKTTFKICVMDEAWRFVRNPLALAYIVEALKTWRKENAAMILATQSMQDLAGSEELLRPVLDNCPTKLLLANSSVDPKVYGDLLGLSATEQERVRQLLPKQQFLLKRDTFSKVLCLNVDPRSYWLFTTNPYEAKKRKDAVERLGLNAALDELAGGNA